MPGWKGVSQGWFWFYLVCQCLDWPWLHLRHREETANRRGPQLNPETIASPWPLWSQIPAVQTTPLPDPNLLGVTGGTFSARGRVGSFRQALDQHRLMVLAGLAQVY